MRKKCLSLSKVKINLENFYPDHFLSLTFQMQYFVSFGKYIIVIEGRIVCLYLRKIRFK